MKQYLLAFHRITKCTNSRFFKIFSGSKNICFAWEKANISDFISWGIEDAVAQEIVCERRKIDPEKELKKLTAAGADVIPFFDKDYPVLLKEIQDPPFLLYVSGRKELLSKMCFAVVGTRMMTSYGKQVIEHIIPPLVQAGLVIVSGLAFGVDAQAHRATLLAEGETIAVLGSGIDRMYPLNNQKLAEEIVAKGGAVLSEFPLGMEPTTYSFPIRNRIISGLSKGVLVVEAKEKSGSLITAQLALDQNREVFAVPGNIFSDNETGIFNLLKQGEAKLVTCAEDILEELGLETESDIIPEERNIRFEHEGEEKVYLMLTKEPQYIDVITYRSGFSSAEVNSILTLLEMRGLASNLGGMKWVRR